MSILTRNNVALAGREGGPGMVFAHGFGCDQTMWRYLTPAFAGRFRIVAFDYAGHGKSELAAYDFEPRYLDDESDGYVGGFRQDDLNGLLGSMESNYLGWSSSTAPVIMGNSERPELGEELTNSLPASERAGRDDCRCARFLLTRFC